MNERKRMIWNIGEWVKERANERMEKKEKWMNGKRTYEWIKRKWKKESVNEQEKERNNEGRNNEIKETEKCTNECKRKVREKIMGEWKREN